MHYTLINPYRSWSKDLIRFNDLIFQSLPLHKDEESSLESLDEGPGQHSCIRLEV